MEECLAFHSESLSICTAVPLEGHVGGPQLPCPCDSDGRELVVWPHTSWVVAPAPDVHSIQPQPPNDNHEVVSSPNYALAGQQRALGSDVSCLS